MGEACEISQMKFAQMFPMLVMDTFYQEYLCQENRKGDLMNAVKEPKRAKTSSGSLVCEKACDSHTP